MVIYEITVTRGLPPTTDELVTTIAMSRSDIRESIERLAVGRALVLQPDTREILMAEPFSAAPTAFTVQTDDRVYFGNCIWDALGIPAMLRRDATIATSCGCCGEAQRLSVKNGMLGAVDGVVHFAIPADRWWEDVVVT
jgi:hypothetical protein